MRTLPTALVGLVLVFILGAPAAASQCVQAASLIATGLGKDSIPGLTDPQMVTVAQDVFWQDTDRVLGVVRNGEARAYPLPILWWHEVVNDVVGGEPIAVTYCPLTGSGLIYDSMVNGDRLLFGTSGLIFDNNLVMYNRGRDESLWSQMAEELVCDTPFEGFQPRVLPVVETSWGAWKQLHPDTTVMTTATGYARNYRAYPYGTYADPGNTQLLYPQSLIDPRLPMKDLVHGIRHGDSARAYSFARLGARGRRVAVNDTLAGRQVLVIFDRDHQMALAFDRRPRVQKKNGTWKNKTLKFEVVDSGDFPFLLRERKTGTLFSLDGVPLEGKLVGRIEGGALTPISEAYTAFWFAWAAFNAGTDLAQ